MVFEQLKKFPASDLYRLFINGNLHAKEKGWVEYAEREPGCITGLFDAFQYVLSYQLEDQSISLELLKNIHQRVTQPIQVSGYKENPMNPGKLRGNIGAFMLGADTKKNGYCNQKGLEELVDFVTGYKNIGSALFIPKLTHSQFNKDIKNGVYTTQEQANKAFDAIWDHYKNMKDDSANISYDNLFEQQWLFRAPSPENIESLVKSVCERYNEKIQFATTKDKKLKVIVSHVQEIERIHPFSDGNGRTSYILLQRLLIQNGFSPTIMANPNHIDGHDLESVIKEIEQGMTYFKELIDNPRAQIFDYQTPLEKISMNDFKSFNPYYPPDDDVDRDKIIKDYYLSVEKLSEFIIKTVITYNDPDPEDSLDKEIKNRTENLEEADTLKKIVEELKRLTGEYDKSMPETAVFKPIKQIISKLSEELTKDQSDQDKIANFYTLLDTNNETYPDKKNIEIIKKDRRRSAMNFLLGITIIAVTFLTGILPGLLIMGIVYAVTGKHIGNLFKTKGEQFEELSFFSTPKNKITDCNSELTGTKKEKDKNEDHNNPKRLNNTL